MCLKYTLPVYIANKDREAADDDGRAQQQCWECCLEIRSA